MGVETFTVEKYSFTCTKVKEYQCICTYKVLRSSANPAGHWEDSPKFFAGEYEWDIELYFGGFSNDSKDYVSCRPCLHNLEKLPPDFEVTVTLSIIDKNHKEHNRQKLTYRKEDNSAEESCFDRFVKRDDLLSSPNLLPNDELKLMCRFSYHVNSGKNRYSNMNDTPLPTLQCRNAIMINYEKIFENPDYSDFQLNVGDTKIKVHKCILAAQSPVFAAMFQNDMMEKAKNEVDIEDVEPDVMRQLLRFIYVGEVEDIDDFADKLFIAADKYQVLKLKELCEETLLQQLSIGNFCETLHFVDKFDATILKDAAIKFIVSNSSKLRSMDVFKKSIQSLSSVLLAQVICALMDKTE